MGIVPNKICTDKNNLKAGMLMGTGMKMKDSIKARLQADMAKHGFTKIYQLRDWIHQIQQVAPRNNTYYLCDGQKSNPTFEEVHLVIDEMEKLNE